MSYSLLYQPTIDWWYSQGVMPQYGWFVIGLLAGIFATFAWAVWSEERRAEYV